MNRLETQINDIELSDKQWSSICILGGVTTIIALIGISLDVILGMITGGNLLDLPHTAIARFTQFQNSKFFGLYNLDFLNILIQIILIPSYFALYVAHRSVNKAYGSLAIIVFLSGSVIMVANNTALPMLELSNKYFTETVESQKVLYAAAGEAMLASGAHGSPGVFLGFFLPNIGGLIMSFVMLKGRIFSKLNSWLGIIGSILILLYIILVNFCSGVENMATLFAMPGGLLLMIWMILFAIKLLSLR